QEAEPRELAELVVVPGDGRGEGGESGQGGQREEPVAGLREAGPGSAVEQSPETERQRQDRHADRQALAPGRQVELLGVVPNLPIERKRCILRAERVGGAQRRRRQRQVEGRRRSPPVSRAGGQVGRGGKDGEKNPGREQREGSDAEPQGQRPAPPGRQVGGEEEAGPDLEPGGEAEGGGRPCGVWGVLPEGGGEEEEQERVDLPEGEVLRRAAAQRPDHGDRRQGREVAAEGPPEADRRAEQAGLADEEPCHPRCVEGKERQRGEKDGRGGGGVEGVREGALPDEERRSGAVVVAEVPGRAEQVGPDDDAGAVEIDAEAGNSHQPGRAPVRHWRRMLAEAEKAAPGWTRRVAAQERGRKGSAGLRRARSR